MGMAWNGRRWPRPPWPDQTDCRSESAGTLRGPGRQARRVGRAGSKEPLRMLVPHHTWAAPTIHGLTRSMARGRAPGQPGTAGDGRGRRWPDQLTADLRLAKEPSEGLAGGPGELAGRLPKNPCGTNCPPPTPGYVYRGAYMDHGCPYMAFLLASVLARHCTLQHHTRGAEYKHLALVMYFHVMSRRSITHP